MAAATAIGNALKTGTPIPRSNSLQRTSSMQRSSSFLSRKPASRSGSLLGLQGPPASFQQQQQQHPQAVPKRSQSLTAGSSYGKKLNAKKSTSSLSSGPRMIKKHIPGPYGLVTIEVPAEEEQKPKVKPRGSQSFTRFSDRGSLRSFQSTGSQSSSPRVKRAIINEPLREVDEEIPEDFEQQEPLYPTEETYESPKVSAPPKLNLIHEEEDHHLNDATQDLEQLQLEKENEELKLKETLDQEQDLEQNALSAKVDASGTVSPVPTEIKAIKETIVSTEPTINADGTIEGAQTPDLENDVLDEYTDIPSTAKSNDTVTAGQSSYSTIDSETEQEHHASSMAQQLRPTIPSLQVNNSKIDTNGPQDTVPASVGLANTVSGETAASSLYSNESPEFDGVSSQPTKSNTNESSQDLQIPARSSKRDSSTSPRKSALKIKSSSTVNLHDTPTNTSNPSNPANAAYLSLTTAENTRLNALSSSNLPATALSRTNSSRHSLRQEPSNSSNNIKTTMRPQQPQTNGPRTTLRQNPLQQQQQQQQYPKVAAPHQLQKRPQSVATSRPEQVNNNRQGRPASAQGFRPQTQAAPSSRISRQPQQQHSPSNAAALSAATKKAEPLKPLIRSSSFEKDRPAESHAAFKRKSLRDPQVNNHANVESQLGFYRHQAAQQNHHNHQHHQPLQQSQQAPQASNGNGHGFAGFRSRFDDSDSDSEAVPTLRKDKKKTDYNFAPPPNNPSLRKPKSQFTLRSSSNSAIPENGSPAKSLPEKRNTRYFSEADKEQLFNEHLKKTEAALHNGEKKKSKFGGKLKKLFGRGNN